MSFNREPMPSDRNVCWHCWQKGKETSGKKAQLRWMYVVEGSKELLCAKCREDQYNERQQYKGYYSSFNGLRRLEDYTHEDYRRSPELFADEG